MDAQTPINMREQPLEPFWARASAWLSWGLFGATLLWAQFPFGSNHAWSWYLLTCFVAVSALAFTPALAAMDDLWIKLSPLALSGALFALVLLWAVYQAMPFSPSAVHNSIWQLSDPTLGISFKGAISMNPFVTLTEVMKLATYVVAGFLAYVLALDIRRARPLLALIIIVGAIYAAYGFALKALGTSQVTLLAGRVAPYLYDMTGGFVNRSNFATFEGMTLVCGFALLCERARETIPPWRTTRQLVRHLVQFVMGRAAPLVFGCLLILGALLASNSRAGFVVTVVAICVVLWMSSARAVRQSGAFWPLVGIGTVIFVIVGLFLATGQSLSDRYAQLATELQDPTNARPIFWEAALRVIADHPLLGVGLGCFQDSYVLYANQTVPFIVDHTHDDYLELALGLGIPAACLWWFGLARLVVKCFSGAAQRRRRRVFSIAAAGVSVLVGLHSLVDFSLQMPAVSLLFAAILGMGLAQSRRTAELSG